MILRPETPADVDAIEAITRAAFADHPHSDGTEHRIVARLRAAAALDLSLVAEEAGAVIGHAAFSPVVIDGAGAGWVGLGPLSVDPRRQRRGFGTAVVEQGLLRLRAKEAAACVVMGDPDYYRRFGFAAVEELVLPDCAPQYFMAIALSGPMACGIVHYHSAFYGDAVERSIGE